jgi:hypothetical protein
MDGSQPEIQPKLVTRSENIRSNVLHLPERIVNFVRPVDLRKSESVLNAMGGREKLIPGVEIESNFLKGFEKWRGMAIEGRNNGNIEYFAGLNLNEGKLIPDPEVREGWEMLSPIGVLPEIRKDQVGTIHTHPWADFFSPLDMVSFLLRKDITMAMVNSSGDVSLMVKSANISAVEKFDIIRKAVNENLTQIVKPSKTENSDEVYERVRRGIRFVLDTSSQLGIIVMRKKVEEEKFRIAK